MPIEDMGGRRKFIRMVSDTDGKIEVKSMIETYFENSGELFTMENYKGQPEFEMFNRANYNVSNQAELPQLVYMTNISKDELAPQHSDNTLDYQKLHPELERWAIFRALPGLMLYDRELGKLLLNMQIGAHKVP